MPTFDTPEPISATIDLGVGDVRITRRRPRHHRRRRAPERPVQRRRTSRAAERDPGRVRGRPAAGQGAEAAPVAAPQRRRLDRRHRRAARRLERRRQRRVGATSHCDGRLGDCRIKTGLGTIERRAAPTALHLKSGAGDISVDRATGARRGHRRIRRRARARARRQRGDQELQRRHLDRRRRRRRCASTPPTASIAVDVASASVVAKTANGDVRLGEVVRGSVVLETRHRRRSRSASARAPPPGSTSAPGAGKVHNALDRRRRPRAVGRDASRCARAHVASATSSSGGQ